MIFRFFRLFFFRSVFLPREDKNGAARSPVFLPREDKNGAARSRQAAPEYQPSRHCSGSLMP